MYVYVQSEYRLLYLDDVCALCAVFLFCTGSIAATEPFVAVGGGGKRHIRSSRIVVLSICSIERMS